MSHAWNACGANAPRGFKSHTRRVSETVVVLNGPNLNLLGEREPHIYGSETLADVEAMCRSRAAELGMELDFRQTNHEGEMVDWLNAAADEEIPVVLNAAAWTHYSLAIYDACAQLVAPLIEVHISDPKQRPEEFRHTSYVEPHATATVAGQGIEGYRAALALAAGRD